MRSHIDTLIKHFFDELEILLCKYEELTDTDVRDSIHLTINHFFVWGQEIVQIPTNYEMFSPEANHAVMQTVEKFLLVICNYPDCKNIELGQSRLDLLQNPNLKTSAGRSYDEFIGHVDAPLELESLPEYLFEEGDYDTNIL